jgi:electron transport complex protein RnfD
MIATTATRPPRDLRSRGLWTRLAILPGALLHVTLLAPERGWMLLVAVVVALVTEGVALHLRGHKVGIGYGDSGALLTGVLLGLLLPPGLPLAAVAAGAAVAVGVRQMYGGTGQYLFHPAMLGLVYVALAWSAPTAAASVHGKPVLVVAAAYALGGLTLIALRIVRWQAPLSLLAGLVLFAVAGALLGGRPLDAAALALFAPATLLVVFFVVGDAVCGGATARGRLAFGAGIAALAALLGRDGALDAALPPAVLLTNLAAPALDRWLARPAPTGPR